MLPLLASLLVAAPTGVGDAEISQRRRLPVPVALPAADGGPGLLSPHLDVSAGLGPAGCFFSIGMLSACCRHVASSAGADIRDGAAYALRIRTRLERCAGSAMGRPTEIAARYWGYKSCLRAYA